MGPATDRAGVLDALIAGGMNCARFNFSHGTHEEQRGRIEAVRAAAKKGLVAEGDRTVITSGIKVASGNTNATRVYTLK